jgi:serine/threonine protein kinase
LERLGIPLNDVFEKNSSLIKICDILKIGIELIKKIQIMHDLGYLHLDLKTDNVLFSKIDSLTTWNKYSNRPIHSWKETNDKLIRQKNYYKSTKYEELVVSEVYITDFGTAKHYRDKDNKHIRNAI